MAKKSRSSKAKASVVMLLAIAVAACGGASERPAASPAEAAPAGASAPAMDNKGAPPPPPETPSTQSAAPAQASSDSAADRKAELASATDDLDAARRDVEASFGDCANVCRALSSLERVTAHFCALASSNSERDACDDAKRRVYKARARIKASCGTCANGAPLDESAPLNSR